MARTIIFNNWYDIGPGIDAARGVQPSTDWNIFPLAALLLRNDGPGAGQEFFNLPDSRIKDAYDLRDLFAIPFSAVELSATGYSRQLLVPDGIETIGGAADEGQWQLGEETVTFGDIVSATPQQSIAAILVYSGPSARILDPEFNFEQRPLYMHEFDSPTLTTGAPVVGTLLTDYLVRARQGS